MDSKEKKPPVPRWECANCSLPDDSPGVILRPCSRCKLVRYCGTDCQAQHWKKGGHKQNCVAPEQRRPQQSSIEVETSGPKCVICMTSMQACESIQLSCSHTFHERCVEALRQSSAVQVCPLCRSNLPDSSRSSVLVDEISTNRLPKVR